MNIGVIGTGIYGVSLSLIMASNGHKVIMWTENENLAKHFKEFHDLKPITEAKIPKSIKITCDLKKALENVELVVLATSAKYVRVTCSNMKKYYNPLIPVCIASKGIENDTYSFLSDIVRRELKAKHVCVISGPTFAVDLINNEPAALSASVTFSFISGGGVSLIIFSCASSLLRFNSAALASSSFCLVKLF